VEKPQYKYADIGGGWCADGSGRWVVATDRPGTSRGGRCVRV